MIAINEPFKSRANSLELIDFCKGIGMILIFMNHSLHSGSNIFNVIGWQGVHIFIVLSGFGLTYSLLRRKKETFSWKNWYVRRFERILPTYWLSCLIGFLITLLLLLLHKPITSDSIGKLTTDLMLDISLLRNLDHRTIFQGSLGHFWFIPFVISYYLIFPLLYKLLKGNLILTTLSTVFIELSYRGLAIYLLDGVPVGHTADRGLNHLPDWILFQDGVPFGICLSRLGEFTLGMAGAVYFFQKRELFDRFIFNYKTIGLGFIFFVIGNLLRKNLWGWIFTDIMISFGLIILTINVGFLIQKKLSGIFLKVSKIGCLSYYSNPN